MKIPTCIEYYDIITDFFDIKAYKMRRYDC